MKKIVLTSEQKEIVESINKPMMVLAGPGTGKTVCIIEKIKFLIDVKKIPYRKICAITFTRAAARELRERLEASGINAANLPYVNTLHGFAMWVLGRYQAKTSFKKNFRLISKIFNKILIKDVLQDLKQKGVSLPYTEQKKFIDAYFRNKAMAGVPNEILINPVKKKILDDFSNSYHEHLDFYNAIDWGDALIEVIRLIDLNNNNVRKEIHEGTVHLLVDEYQDLSPLEQRFIDKILGDQKGLCVVGDDDQSIYETFRFADPLGMVNFTKKYPIAKTFNISICWRCPAEIIRCALSLIKNNKQRVSIKKLVPFDKKNKGVVIIQPQKSKKEEIKWLVARILDVLKRGFNPQDIMVLFPDGDVAKDYVEALKSINIPLNVQLKIAKMFDSDHFLGLISMIRWMLDDRDNLSLRQFLYYWKGIGSETARQLRLQALSVKIPIWKVVENIAKNPDAFKKIRQRKELIKAYNYLRDMKDKKDLFEIMDKFFDNFPKSKKDKGCHALKDYLDSFKGKEKFITLKEIHDSFEQKIESGELENEYKKKSKGVCIMTMHSAKGCEASVVIIPALEDDIVPGSAVNIEEKRRLFYVSITRAKEALFLSWAQQRSGPEIHKVPGRKMLDKKNSRFLSEMNIV